jgi:hypothetical protein
VCTLLASRDRTCSTYRTHYPFRYTCSVSNHVYDLLSLCKSDLRAQRAKALTRPSPVPRPSSSPKEPHPRNTLVAALVEPPSSKTKPPKHEYDLHDLLETLHNPLGNLKKSRARAQISNRLPPPRAPHQATCACTNRWHSGENAAWRTSPGAVPSMKAEPIGVAGEYAVKGVAEDPGRSVCPSASR